MSRWRGLAAGVAMALAAHAPAHAVDADCLIDAREAPSSSKVYAAVVVGLASPDEVRTQTEIAVRKSGAPISPAYVELPRIVASFEAGGARHETIAAVVNGRIPRPGETVQLASRHRDAAEPCAFIPWTVLGGQTAPVKADADGAIYVPIIRRGTNYYVPVTLNGRLTVEFMIDSGASVVVMPATLVEALQRGGTLGQGDVLGQAIATLADGSKHAQSVLRLHSVTVGGKTLLNVAASGGPAGGQLLLGQSFLGRFKSWSIDNAKSALVLR